MTTNRVPIARHGTPQITPRALEAYRKLRALEIGCDAWWDAQFEIHRALNLRPWEMAIDWPGLGEWEPDPAAVARWQMFEQAAREPTATLSMMGNVKGQGKDTRGRKRRGPHVAAEVER